MAELLASVYQGLGYDCISQTEQATMPKDWCPLSGSGMY